MKQPRMIQFSKWFLRVLVYVYIFGVVYGALFLIVELVLMVVLREYNPMITIELGAYFVYLATPISVGGMGYYQSQGKINAKKVEAAYDPHYDDKFNEGEQ